MKAKRSVLCGERAGAMLALGLCLSGQAVFGAPTQWTALYNRGQPLATYVVGDALDYQFEFAINTDTTGWVVEYGVGQNADGSDWTWYPADWSRMDGSDNRVWISKLSAHQFTSPGTRYYAGRFVNGGDIYYAATDWTANGGEPLAAESYFQVNDLEPPNYVSADRSPLYPATRALLSWTPMNMDKNVLITMSTESWPDGSPVPGTAYSAGQTFGNQTVIAGSQSGMEFEVPGLEPDQVYYFCFYSENHSYYSAAQSAMPVFTARPQARNTNGGAPETPAEIFLGDAGVPFGLDSWGTLDGNWGRASMLMSQGEGWESTFWGDWTDFTDAEHKALVSGVFSATGTWHWCVQLDYNGSDMPEDAWWYLNSSADWADLERNGDVTQSGLTVNVQPINDPSDVFAGPGYENPTSQIDLFWMRNAQNHSVMVVRKLATDEWTEPVQGRDTWYMAGDRIGAGTVVYSDYWGLQYGCTVTGLTAGATYDFKIYSINDSSFYDIPLPYGSSMGLYYSPGVEVQAATLWDYPVVIDGCTNIQTVSVDGSPVSVSFAVSARAEMDPNPTVVADPPSGSLFPVGDTLVAVTAWDAFGHTNTCDFTVSVLPDTTRPVISGGAGNYFVSAYDTTGVAIVYSWVTVSDSVDPNPTLQFVPSSGSVLPLGTNTVAVTGRDAAGNITNSQFRVIVSIPAVVAWGSNSYGQCTVPTGLASVVTIETKYQHNLALLSNGRVRGWGMNSIGQSTGVSVWSNIVAVSAKYHSLGLCSDGRVVAIDSRYAGYLDWPGILTDIVAVSAGSGYSRVLREDGAVAQWPNGGVWESLGAVAISAGEGTKLTLRYDGTVLDESGNIVPGLSNVVAVQSGQYHNLALRANGTVVAWGYNNYGVTSVPPGLSNVVAIAAGAYHDLALRSDGTVVAWGRNSEGQCDIPAGLKNVVDISAGMYHSIARVRVNNPGGDVTPPVIYGCTNRTVPLGKPALYMVRVFDDIDPRPVITYDPPLGTVLPGGDTVVTVTAWDASGNTNTCQFTVTVPVPSPVVSQDAVNVREGGEGRFFVRLNQAPEGNVAVSVSRSAGHSSLWVKSGATRTFTPANWSAWQVVTLAASDDANADGETATFRISSPGAADQFVAATALDDDVGENLALASGGATISGQQSDKAGQAIDGIHLASSNYGSTFWTNVPPGTMTLDLQAATAVSRIRLLTYDWNYRSHRYVVESSLDGATWSNLVDAATGEHRGWEEWAAAGRTARYLRFTGLSNSTTRAVCVAEWEVYGERISVLADQTIDFPSIPDQTPAGVVALAATASSGLPVSYAVASGPGSLAGATLTFTGEGSVTIVASQAGNGAWNPAPDVSRTFNVIRPSAIPEISQTNVNVREGGEGRFFVRLNQAPEGNVAVSVSRNAGHPSLWVKSGATRTFTPANWSAWQVVTLAASDDENADGETATFRISAPGAADQFVAATALDDDVGENLALASGGATIAGQQSDKAGQAIDGIHLASTNYGSTFWTNVPPGTMTLDLQAATTVSRIRLLTYDWNCRSHQYIVESSLDGATWSNLVDAATGEHRGWEEWAAAGRTARYLRFTGLSNSTTRAVCVAEWEVYGERISVLADQTIDFPSIPDQTTAGVVALAATASSGLPVSFAVASGPGSLAGATLTFTGEGSVTIVASQAGNGAWNPAPDVSRTFNVIRPSAIPEISQTNVNVREGGEGRFFVRLNQAPEGNVAVSVSRSAGHPSLWVKSGATRTFTPANWSAWQVVTLAASDDENADGETATFRISSPGAADQFVAATALDDDVGENLALASGGATISGQQSDKAGQAIDGMHLANTNYGSTFWTNVPPGTMTLDLQAATTVSRIRLLTYDWNYRSHRYVVESSLDGATWSNLVDAATGEHRGWEDWAADGRTARYLRFTGLSNSTTRAVCVAEWEVYGERPAAAKAMVLPKRESIAPAPEQGPAAPEIFTTTVLTSDGTEDETGWNAVDGDEETAWVGQKVGGGYIVAEYQPALELSALEVVLDEGSLTNIQYLYSADASNWQPLPDDLESNPISLNYLWLVFPGDGSAAVPHVLEIVPNP